MVQNILNIYLGFSNYLIVKQRRCPLIRLVLRNYIFIEGENTERKGRKKGKKEHIP